MPIDFDAGLILVGFITRGDCGAQLNGAISGRALYDGAIDLSQALKALAL
jgi:phosphoribosylformimino-5-aminoimidazole carboxamide ribotide isomerase